MRLTTKILITTFMLVVLSHSPAFARQVASSSKPSSPVVVGLEGGPMLSSPSFSSTGGGPYPMQWKVKGLGGVFMDTRPSKSWSIVLEGLAGDKGSTSSEFPTRFSIWTIELPVLARLNLTSGRGSHLYAIGGPAFDLLFKRTMTGNTMGLTDPHIGRVDLAVVGGVGVARKALRFEVRYTAGLTNISTQANTTDRTRTLAILVGVGFKK